MNMQTLLCQVTRFGLKMSVQTYDFVRCKTLFSQVALVVKNLLAMQETWAPSLDWDNPLEEGMATHSGILAQRIPWTDEPAGLQSIVWQRVGHN